MLGESHDLVPQSLKLGIACPNCATGSPGVQLEGLVQVAFGKNGSRFD